MKLTLQILILIFSLTAYVIFTQLLFEETNLIELKGKLQYSYQFTRKENFKGNEINVAYLSFTFMRKEENNQFFNIKLNIDSLKRGVNIFSGVRKSLNDASEISVWIEKADESKLHPKVYKIYADEENIYERIKKPFDRIYLFTLFGCSILIVCSLYWLYIFKT